MIRSLEWAALSPFGVKLLLDLGQQYNGSNNGDLCATWKFMHARGWRSPSTLSRALKECAQKGWVELTRQGGRHRASLYALTYFPINECGGKLDVSSSRTPSHRWRNNTLPGPLVKQSSPDVNQLPAEAPPMASKTGPDLGQLDVTGTGS